VDVIIHEHPQVRVNDPAHRLGAMLILLATSLGMLVAQIDTSVVNLAIKQIGSDLDAGVNAFQWVVDVYNLLFATLMLTDGRLADRFGRLRIFIIGLMLFALGSVICAVAPNIATRRVRHHWPMSVTFVVVSQWSGMLTNRFGPHLTMSVGVTCLGSGLLLLSRVAPPMNLLGIAMAMFVLGVGLGLNAGPVLAVAIANAPRSHVGTASGLVNTARMIGATLGVAALGAVFAAVAGGTGAGTLARGSRAALLCGAASELVGAVLAFRFVHQDSHRSLAAQSEPTVQ
jgi:MFS family permease